MFCFGEKSFEDLGVTNCATFDLKDNVVVTDYENIINYKNGNPFDGFEISINTVLEKNHKKIFMLEEYAENKWIAVSLKV